MGSPRKVEQGIFDGATADILCAHDKNMKKLQGIFVKNHFKYLSILRDEKFSWYFSSAPLFNVCLLPKFCINI